MADQEQAIFRLTIMSTCESPRLTKMSINEGPKDWMFPKGLTHNSDNNNNEEEEEEQQQQQQEMRSH